MGTRKPWINYTIKLRYESENAVFAIRGNVGTFLVVLVIKQL